MKNKNLIFTILGFVGILVFKFIIESMAIKSANDTFINDSYLYLLISKPNEDEGDKGTYKYHCVDLDKKLHWYKKRFGPEISGRKIYRALIVGDTIQKDKGTSFILLKRKKLVLNIPADDFNSDVDTILVR